MNPATPPRRAVVQAELNRRIAALREQSPTALRALPSSLVDESDVAGTPVRFTTGCNHEQDGRILIVIRSDYSVLWGLTSTGSTEGFWLTPDDRKVDASVKDIMDFEWQGL
jgi:hypothetical protein